jgi:hypothetical protein
MAESQPEKQVLREIRQARSEEAAAKILSKFSQARWSEGYDEGFHDGGDTE